MSELSLNNTFQELRLLWVDSTRLNRLTTRSVEEEEGIKEEGDEMPTMSMELLEDSLIVSLLSLFLTSLPVIADHLSLWLS